MTKITLEPGRRSGTVTVPPSKSHHHRLLIANFLADRSVPRDAASDSDDILATKRCLRALAAGESKLDCGESGSTLRFLAPVAAALGVKADFVRRGRLADRPFKSYTTIESGLHPIPGDISSQFATGLLFALPLLKGDSQIQLTSALESRGYVEMTLAVLRGAGIVVEVSSNGFLVRGSQRYLHQDTPVDGDWSGAAYWLAMNALGSSVAVEGLNDRSPQPDRVAPAAIANIVRKSQALRRIDVRETPDLFPTLAVVAASQPAITRFTGIERLRYKESDRVAAMADVLIRLGAEVEDKDGTFLVRGTGGGFPGGEFRTYRDHRIAMALAIAATHAEAPVVLDDADCVAKSYPGFFDLFASLKV